MAFRVLVVGSLRNEVEDAEKLRILEKGEPGQKADVLASLPHFEAFKTTCRNLGRAMDEQGMEIILGTDDEIDADPWIVDGAAEGGKKPRIHVICPADGTDDPYADVKASITLNVTRKSGPWAAVQIAQIQKADAVIVIGGRAAVRTVGYAAPALDKPVLAIPWFGGAAKEMWDAFRDTYARVEMAGNPILGWGVTRRAATPEDATIAVDMLVKLRAQGVFRTRDFMAKLYPWLVLFLCVVLVGVWVVLFGYPDAASWCIPVSGPARYFTVLAAAAFLGVFLRNSLRVVFDAGDVATVRRFLAELTCGLLLAFGLALMFLVGAITIDGDARMVLENPGPDAGPSAPGGRAIPAGGGFERVAVIMTLLGLAGGLLIEQAADNLRRWLTGRLDESAGRK